MDFPIRYLILALIILASSVIQMSRLNLNVAIVAMVRKPIKDSNETKIVKGSCPLPKVDNEEHLNSTKRTRTDSPIYDWSESDQGILLGSFFYSYVAMQIPGARMAETFGGKWIVCLALLGSGVINLITPLISSSFIGINISRVVLGFLQGGIYPAGFSMLVNWLPRTEKSLGFALMEVGGDTGSVATSGLAGYLSDAGGWPLAFYVPGLVALVVVAIFALLVTSSPETHRFVTIEELRFIADASNDRKNSEAAPVVVKPATPWAAILTSRTVLGLVYGRFALGWSALVLQAKLPAYLSNVLHVDSTTIGLLTGLMYASGIVSGAVCGGLSEWIIQKSWLTRTNARKAFGLVGYLGSSLCLALVPFQECSVKGVMVLVLIARFSMGITAGGDLPIAGEITTNFAATIYSIMNFSMMCTGFITPYVVGVVLGCGDDVMFLWSLVFWSAGAFSVTGAVVFAVFATSDLQWWDNPNHNRRGTEPNLQLSGRLDNNFEEKVTKV